MLLSYHSCHRIALKSQRQRKWEARLYGSIYTKRNSGLGVHCVSSLKLWVSRVASPLRHIKTDFFFSALVLDCVNRNIYTTLAILFGL